MIFLCIAGFLASFIDSIAGGGGLISVPAFMLAGLSPHIVLGTNKLAATTGSFTSSLKFAKSGLCNFDLLKKLIPFTLVGSIIGVRTVLLIDQKFLQPLVLVLVLCIGVYTLFSKSLGQEDNFKGLTKKNISLGMLLAFTLGFYDGFFGPGTGSFLVFGMINIFGFNFLNASANARFSINYSIGLLVAVFMIIGARAGTKLAINKGAKIIKPIFVTMSLAVALKMLLTMF